MSKQQRTFSAEFKREAAIEYIDSVGQPFYYRAKPSP